MEQKFQKTLLSKNNPCQDPTKTQITKSYGNVSYMKDITNYLQFTFKTTLIFISTVHTDLVKTSLKSLLSQWEKMAIRSTLSAKKTLSWKLGDLKNII